MEVRLSESALCRLCAADNPQGTPIYVVDEDGANLSELINSYLPLKVIDDGIYSRTICPGCNIQLEATVEFFNLIINGQRVLREVLQLEKEYEVNDVFGKSTLENGVYAVDHSVSLQMAGLDKPKRKRGRPKKILNTEKVSESKTVLNAEQPSAKKAELPLELSGKRRRKAPERLKETVQGKELERIFREEGVIDGEESDSEKNDDTIKPEVVEGPVLDEVIGHMQAPDGKPIGEPIRINKGKGRGRRKGPTRPNKQNCIICGTEFSCLGRYMSHVAQHGPVEYQCAPCGATFDNRLLFNEHQEQNQHQGQNIIKRGKVNEQEEGQEPVIDTNTDTDAMQQSAPTLHQMLTSPSGTALTDSLANGSPDPATSIASEDTYIVHVQAMDDDSEFVDFKSIGVNNLDVSSMMTVVNNPDIFIQNETDHNGTPQTMDAVVQEADNSEQQTASMVQNLSEEQNAKETHDQASGKLKCPHCDKLFSSKQSKSMHIKAQHARERPYACKECGAKFAYPRSLTLHMVSHRKTKSNHKGYACDICGKVLNHPSSVVYHKEAEHAGQRYECIKCGKLFRHRQLLQRHQLVHTQARPYSCKLCSATFKTKANLLNHQALHTGIKKYQCGLCKHMFAHKTSLTLHMRWHSGLKPHSCDECGKSFTQRGNLVEHRRTHTGEKPYSCGQCARTFTTSSQHRLHLRRHAGERPFTCTHCGKKFVAIEAWRAHMRRELGQLDYWCTVCGRGFAERWAMLKHQRCHTGEKPHSCPYCPRAFADSSNLAKHKKTHKTSLLVQDNKRHAPAPPAVSTDGAGVGGAEVEGEEKVIYVTYSVDGGEDEHTFHILDPEQAARLDDSKVLTTCSLYEGDSLLVGDEQIELATMEPEEQGDTADMRETLYMEQDMDGLMMHPQMSVTDEDGNPVQLTMQDGTTIEITSADGKSIQIMTEDGQTVPFDLNDYKEDEVGENVLEMAEGAESGEVRMLSLDYFTIT